MVLKKSLKVLLVIFLGLQFSVIAQEKKLGNNVVIDYQGESFIPEDSSGVILERIKRKSQQQDKERLNFGSFQEDFLEELASEEGLRDVGDKEFQVENNFEKVFSRKEWMNSGDSLLQLSDVNKPLGVDGVDLSAIPLEESDLINIINAKIGEEPSPAVDSKVNDSEMLSNVRVKDLKLDDSNLIGLPSASSYLVDSKYLKSIDSIRDVNLEFDRLRFKEITISENVKIADFEKKDRFWDKTYFDGVVGFFKDEEFVLQASPALAFYVSEKLSVGIGPNLNLRVSESVSDIDMGLRGLIKYEVLKKRAYAQFENTVSEISYKTSEDKNLRVYNQSTLIGAGYVLSLKTKLTFNFAVFYQIAGDAVNQEIAPFVLRIGISSIKKGK